MDNENLRERISVPSNALVVYKYEDSGEKCQEPIAANTVTMGSKLKELNAKYILSEYFSIAVVDSTFRVSI